MESKLSTSTILTEEAKKNYNLRNSLYHAYNEKKGYGDDIQELPFEENDSFMTVYDENWSNIQEVSNHDATRINKVKNKRGMRDGTILKIVPQDIKQVYRMTSPIKYVRILEFNYPIDSKFLHVDGTARNKGYFNQGFNIYEHKRVTETKYQKEDGCFSIEIEERSFHKKCDKIMTSNQIEYYKKWLYSQGTTTSLLLIDSINIRQNFMKQRKTLFFNTEKTHTILYNQGSTTEYYFKKLDNTTLEWIKTQPCITRTTNLNHSCGMEMSLVEESFNIKYLELIKMDISDTYKVHSLLKKFKISSNLVTNDLLGTFGIKSSDNYESYQQNLCEYYLKFGLQKPDIISLNRTTLIKNINNDKELYQGHFVIWSERWLSNKSNYIKFYLVILIDEEYKSEN